jgi:hypothetical protein
MVAPMRRRSLYTLPLLLCTACSGPPEPTAPPAATRWVGMQACKHEAYVYAAGTAASAGMSRTSAEGRARQALVGAPTAKVVLRNSEIIDTHSDDTGFSALARTTDPSIDRSALPDCAPAALAWRGAPVAGCPDWTVRTAWIGGGQRHAVGVVMGIQNPSLGARTAQNRARAELVKLESLEVGGGSSVSSGQPADARLVEQVECGGGYYAHVVM